MHARHLVWRQRGTHNPIGVFILQLHVKLAGTIVPATRSMHTHEGQQKENTLWVWPGRGGGGHSAENTCLRREGHHIHKHKQLARKAHTIMLV